MTKSRRNQRIKIDQLKATSNQLENLKKKPKQSLTWRESILDLKDKIKAALKKGYMLSRFSGNFSRTSSCSFCDHPQKIFNRE